MANDLTIGSLFSGVGGLELGLERAGLGPVIWQAEQSAFCRAVLAKHWPGATRYDDVTLMVGGEMAGTLKKMSQEQAAEAVKMYDAGQSIGPIAAFYGVSRQGMWDLLRRRTTMRPQRRVGSQNVFYRGGSTADGSVHNMVESALRYGALERPDICDACKGPGRPFSDGRSPIQAHHDDYNKPLAVRWLCQPCHHEWHAHNTAIRREVPREAPAVDVICGGFP